MADTASSLTTDEERVTCKHSLAGIVLHEEADTILGMTRRVHALDRDASNLELFFMLGGSRHAFAVLAANDFQVWRSQLG